jgi:hypothetical protein
LIVLRLEERTGRFHLFRHRPGTAVAGRLWFVGRKPDKYITGFDKVKAPVRPAALFGPAGTLLFFPLFIPRPATDSSGSGETDLLNKSPAAGQPEDNGRLLLPAPR